MTTPTEALSLARELLAEDRAALVSCHAVPAGGDTIPAHDQDATVALVRYDTAIAAIDALAQQASVPSAEPQTAPVAPEPVKADGRLHADGYFTWARRDGYAMDKKLPCDFYLAAPAAPAPAVQPLTDVQWLKLRTAKTGERLRRNHDERAKAEFLGWMRFAENVYGITLAGIAAAPTKE